MVDLQRVIIDSPSLIVMMLILVLGLWSVPVQMIGVLIAFAGIGVVSVAVVSVVVVMKASSSRGQRKLVEHLRSR